MLKEQRPADAEAQLQQALGWFHSVGVTRYIREAEQLRDSIKQERAGSTSAASLTERRLR